MPNVSIRESKSRKHQGDGGAFLAQTVKVLDCLAAGVVVADQWGELLYWNPTAIRLHGFRPEEVTSRPLEEFCQCFRLCTADGVLDFEDWPLSRLLRGQTVTAVELALERLDNGQRWFFRYDGAVLPADDESGQTLFVLTIHDLTPEREAQSQLSQTAELFRAVTESTEDAVFVKDLEGKYLHFNAAAGRFAGRNPQQVLGQDDSFLFDPEGAELIRLHDRMVIDTEQATMVEEVLTNGGVRRTFQASKSPYRDQTGKVVGLVGISRDITESKRFKQDLISERERFERLATVAPGALHTYHTKANGEHRFAYTTPALEEIYGVSTALMEQDANNALSRVHRDDLALLHSSIRTATEKMEAWSCEYRVLHPQRGEIWIEGRSCPVPDGEGGLFWHGILVDITAHKEAAAALKAEKDRFQYIVDSVPGAIYSFCMRPDGSSYFSYASPVLENIFGVPVDQLSLDASPIFQIVSPDYLPELLKSVQHSRDTLEPWCAQIPFQHARRGLCWADGHSIPTRAPDGSTVWHGYLWDSTERRTLEQQFWQAQKMEAVGCLAGGVAHDFNNLLTVINGHAHLSLQETRQEDPVYARLLQIREAGERSARLTRQLLAFSKQSPIEPRIFDANAQIQESQKMLRRLIGEDIEFQLELAPCSLPVFLDLGQFEQLILNLVVNARDAMPLGGRLTVTTRNCEGELLLSIRDSGCGMTPEVLLRIFDPFYTTKEVGKGTGLGLAVVHGVVTRGGGRVEVESEPGVGTLFRFYFPLAPAAVEQAAPPEKDSFRGTETILVVEDEPAVRQVLVQGLQKYGYKVLVAESGRRAIELSESTSETIDLMLSDVVMPGLSGPEAARQIFQSRPTLKILFMTGYTEDARIPPGILRKPFTPQIVAQKIREALAGPHKSWT